MIRSFVVASFTIAVVVMLSPWQSLLAQGNKPVATNVPVQISGGKEGVNLEFYVNLGKVANATVDAGGNASVFLDFSNLGKVQVHVYVDECQDGQTVKVMVQPGQSAEDNGCKRRVAVGAFWTNCGAIKLSLDLTKWGMHVGGCGNFFQSPAGIGTVAGILTTGLIVGTRGGGDSPTMFQTTPIPSTSLNPTVSVTPTVTVTPVTTSTNVSNSGPQQPAPPNEYTVTIGTTTYEHTQPGVFSVICGSVATSPAQPNAPVTIVTTGPGVLQQTIGIILGAGGTGTFRVQINQVGPYTFVVTVTSGGTTKTANGSANVTTAPGPVPCP